MNYWRHLLHPLSLASKLSQLRLPARDFSMVMFISCPLQYTCSTELPALVIVMGGAKSTHIFFKNPQGQKAMPQGTRERIICM